MSQPKNEVVGFAFCESCEVPDVCTNPAVLRTAQVAIRSMLKGHTDVADQLLDSGFDNEQAVAIFQCLSRNSTQKCTSLVDPHMVQTKGSASCETC